MIIDFRPINCAPDLFFSFSVGVFLLENKKGQGGGRKTQRRTKETCNGCNEAKIATAINDPSVLWHAFPNQAQDLTQKYLLPLRIGIRLTETVTVAVTVSMQLAGQSEGNVRRLPVVFGREVPTVDIMVEVPVVVIRVGDGDAVGLATGTVPEVPVKPGDAPLSNSVPVRG